MILRIAVQCPLEADRSDSNYVPGEIYDCARNAGVFPSLDHYSARLRDYRKISLLC